MLAALSNIRASNIRISVFFTTQSWKSGLILHAQSFCAAAITRRKFYVVFLSFMRSESFDTRHNLKPSAPLKMNQANPKLIVLMSGKRKSGKDYVCEKLISALGALGTAVRISEPLKRLYAENHGLSLADLMSDSPYKEKYRKDMIVWSEAIRAGNKGYFCKAACDTAAPVPVWIVCDVRRKTDVEWFKTSYGDKIRMVRVTADLAVREKRGWCFTAGIDDAESECNLDDFSAWDLVVSNNNDDDLHKGLDKILTMIKQFVQF